jgi:hypothetical protein
VRQALIRRLPLISGIVAGLAALLLIGPIAVAVVLLRSSSDAVGPGLGAHMVIAVLVLLLTVGSGLAVAALVRLVLRLTDRHRRR